MFVEITGWVNAVNASFMKASCQMFNLSVSGVLSSGRLHFPEFREEKRKSNKQAYPEVFQAIYCPSAKECRARCYLILIIS